jgi:hypothetical protein
MNFVPPADQTDAQIALADLQLRQLAELRELAMSRARALDAPGADGKAPDPVSAGRAFTEVAKAVRQIMALEQEVIGLREKRRTSISFERQKETKTVVRRVVERSLRTAGRDTTGSAGKRLLTDLFDRRDLYDYAKGNARDIVADICKTLDVEADLSLWDEPGEDEAGISEVRKTGSEKFRNGNGYTNSASVSVSHSRPRGGAPPDG